MNKVAVLLSGGAALGALQVHSCERIQESAIADSWDVHWYGVSVGALHAFLGAQGRVYRMRELWGSMKGTGWFMRPHVNPLNGVMTLAPLARKLAKEQKHPLIDHCEVGVTDYERGPKYQSIYLNDMERREQRHAILASAAQPLIMKGWPVSFPDGHRLCFDGGVKHLIPTVSDWHTYDRIYVISCSSVRRYEAKKRRKVNSLGEIAGRTAEAWLDSAFQGDWKRIQGWAQNKDVIWIAPEEKVPGEKIEAFAVGDPFDACQPTIQARLELGKRMWELRRQL